MQGNNFSLEMKQAAFKDFEAKYRGALEKLYTEEPQQLNKQLERYCNLLSDFFVNFDHCDNLHFFSTPGRSEIMGNHTDHQRGKVICASVSLDLISVVRPNDANVVRLRSKGYGKTDIIDLDDLSVHEEEKSHSAALIRGVAARLHELGYKIGGFDCYTLSNVPGGSGLSSSAAFEVMICTIFDHLFNGNVISPLERAQISQYAENVYFDKPCGLMDQCGCSFGGMIAIDFANPKEVKIKELGAPFAGSDYQLLISKAGGTHADLTDDYASIPEEMRAVARCFGVATNVLSDVAAAEFWRRLPQLRGQVSDRALLRAMHFYNEQERVTAAGNCLAQGDIEAFLALVNASGLSSWTLLQNIYSPAAPQEQPVSLALAASKAVLGNKGASRVHGGGFAGTIQAYVPHDLVDAYSRMISGLCGDDAVLDLNIRPYGSVCLDELL